MPHVAPQNENSILEIIKCFFLPAIGLILVLEIGIGIGDDILG